MADYGVSVTWGDSKPGREKKGLELWMDVVTTNDKAVANGRIASWDSVLFEPTGAGPAGAIRIFGTRLQVEEFIQSEDFQGQILHAGLLTNAVALRRFVTGEALADEFANYSKVVQAL